MKLYKIGITIVIFLVLVIGIILLNNKDDTEFIKDTNVNYISFDSSNSLWYDSYYTKSKNITITENSGNNLINYSVMLPITFTVGMQNDFSDLMFVENNKTVLSHWVDSYTSGVSANVWVKIPNMTANVVHTIRMYYGRTGGIDLSNVSDAFYYYDDFSSFNNVTYWNNTYPVDCGVSPASWLVCNTSTAYATVMFKFSKLANISVSIKTNSTGGTPVVDFVARKQTSATWDGVPNGDDFYFFYNQNGQPIEIYQNINGGYTSLGSTTNGNASLSRRYILYIYNNTMNQTMYENGNPSFYITSPLASLNTRDTQFKDGYFGIALHNTARQMNVDWIIIRNYQNLEPSASFGAAESGGGGMPTINQVPSVQLNTPANGITTNSPLNYFQANFSDDYILTNATLYIWNSTYNLIYTTTAFISGIANTTNNSYILPNYDVYKWNYKVYDNNSNYSLASSNFSLIYSGSFLPVDSLIGRYEFDNCTGSIAEDTSGFGNDGTVVNALWNSTAKVGTCDLTFNGDNAYVSIPDSYLWDTYDMSICAWIRAGINHNSESVVDRGHYSSKTNGWSLEIGNYSKIWGFGVSHGDGVSTDAYSYNSTLVPTTTNGEWQHLCGTYNYSSGVVLIYQNGYNVQGELAGSTISRANNNIPVFIGKRNIGGGDDPQYFNGSIDQVLIYNKTLTASDVAGIYGYISETQSFNPPIVTLVSPQNGFSSTQSVYYFNASFTAFTSLSNSTFYIWNSTNSLMYNATNAISGLTNYSNVSYTLPSYGTYKWNYKAYDNNSNYSFASSNFTITYNSAPAPVNGLVLWYDFEEGSGNILTDRSGNGHNGVITGATWSSGLVDDYSLKFNGIDNKVCIPDSPSFDGSQFTLLAWVNASRNIGHAQQSIIDRGHTGTDTGYQLELIQYGTNMNFGPMSDPAWKDNIGTRLNNVQWFVGNESSGNISRKAFLASSYNYSSGEIRLYIDGVEIPGYYPDYGTTWSANRSGLTVNTNKQICLGRRESGDPQGFWFNGTMDEIRMYNYTLSGDKIYDLYLNGLGLGGGPPDTTAPIVTLDNPTNGLVINRTGITFNASFTDDIELANVTFYLWDTTGLVTSFLTSLSGTSNTYNYSYNVVSETVYFWNYLAVDNSSNRAWASSNYSFAYQAPNIETGGDSSGFGNGEVYNPSLSDGPYPMLTGNETNLYDYFSFVNNGVKGIFMPIILFAVWIIAFIGALAEGRQASRGFIFASFIFSILAIMLSLIGMLNPQYMYFSFLMVAAGLVWYKLDNAPGM